MAKTITIEISVAEANDLLDATSNAALLRAIAKALAGAPAESKPAAAPVKAARGPVKTAAKPAAEEPKKRGRKASSNAAEDAATILTRMASGTQYSAETLKKETKLDKPAFVRAIKLLVGEGKVTQSGEKRGTRYAVA